MAKRKIIKIDEEKCNGCGACVTSCAEGALKVVGGKARLVNEVFCDGLGACIGECPQGALTIEERDAPEFDEKKAVTQHKTLPCGCPGSNVMQFDAHTKPETGHRARAGSVSRLRQWPVQIKLVPANAPYLNGADMLIAADCVPFAYAGFHEELLKDKALLVGCPKLDDLGFYRERIGEILKNNNIKSVTYARMEVPCCSGLVGVIKDAIASSGRPVPFIETVIGIKGERVK